jgi:hypothetical protein
VIVDLAVDRLFLPTERAKARPPQAGQQTCGSWTGRPDIIAFPQWLRVRPQCRAEGL